MISGRENMAQSVVSYGGGWLELFPVACATTGGGDIEGAGTRFEGGDVWGGVVVEECGCYLGFEWGAAVANGVRGYKDGYLIPDERGGHGGRWVSTL